MKGLPIFTFLHFSFFVFVVSYAYSDLEALLKLKSSMTGPSGSGLEDWVEDVVSPSMHCSFSGVSCDENSRVTALTVASLPLFGTIPPEIGLLNMLLNLTLVSNNLTGSLPLEMSNLTSINFINLSANSIFGGGEFVGKIVATMSDLEVLDVYNNNFTGKLPVEFAKLKRLRALYLGGNYFSGEIPEDYSEIHSLERLGLQGNGLGGRIPASLSRLSSLEELLLGYFNVYEGGIPPEFGLLRSLKILDLGGSNLSGEIPASLGNLKMLHTLFLQCNSFTGKIPLELSGLVSLKYLDLSINKLTGEIPLSFSELQNLTLINLFSNHLVGPIPQFIGDLPHLEVLQIWGNNFTSELPKNLGGNGNILDLDVSFNHLTGTIPRDLCKGRSLKTLIVMQNYFVGPIPQELGNCKSLTRIRMGKNFFNGSVPVAFFNLPVLTMLELDDNRFTGELPTEMSGKSLEIVTLSNNRITGRVPPAVGMLLCLSTLHLQMNSFYGEIPNEISNLKMLDNLNISDNNFTGKIPASIASCARLTSVDLSQNRLFGRIPIDILSLPDINFLNLSRNLLSGSIPSQMGYMEHLTVLDLSYNNLSGRVPLDWRLRDFDDSIFAGNPNLCPPHHCNVPSKIGTSQKIPWFSTSKFIASVFAALTVLLISIATFWIIRRKILDKSNAWRLTALERLHFEVKDVLECLREENIIGRGGAGIMYRGSMPNGLVVVIKRLTIQACGRIDRSFSVEIQTLGRIRHRNIVRLLGYLSNKNTNLLLYEYMPNGSLGDILHGPNMACLPWEMRYRIAVDVAKGLSYLHHDCSPLIIHRNVKSNNIMLDSEYEAHVADFGLAKLLRGGASECMSTIAGSFGYIAPEYTHTLKVDEKSDVYSFGVVLLELISGKKPVGEFGDGMNIVMWVREMKAELSQQPISDADLVLAMLDSRLTDEYPLESVVKMLRIAMVCVEDVAAVRPTMREVVHQLTTPSFQKFGYSMKIV